MNPEQINADKPHLWKADIAASVDQFNQWFMRFAPEAFRSTRVKTTEHVKAGACSPRDDLRSLDAATLRANPSAPPNAPHVYRAARWRWIGWSGLQARTSRSSAAWRKGSWPRG